MEGKIIKLISNDYTVLTEKGIIIPKNIPIGTYILQSTTASVKDTDIRENAETASSVLLRGLNALLRANYKLLEELEGKTDEELLKLRDMGVAGVAQVIRLCNQHGINILVTNPKVVAKLQELE